MGGNGMKLNPQTDKVVSTISPEELQEKAVRYKDQYKLYMTHSDRQKEKTLQSYMDFLDDSMNVNQVQLQLITAFNEKKKIDTVSYYSFYNYIASLNRLLGELKLHEQALMFPASTRRLAGYHDGVSWSGYL